MKLLVWAFRLLVFIALFGLAIKNDGLVELRFFFGGQMQAPLSLVILAAFACGTVVGVSAAVVTLLRQKFEIGRLRRGSGEP